jgi:flavin-dependent dehydrogenase
MLLSAALDRGACIHYGCEDFQLSRSNDGWLLHIIADQITHRSPVLVDASGRAASLARRLGLAHTRQDAQVCLHSFLASPTHDEDTTTRLLADRNGWWYCVRIPNGHRVLAYHTDAKHPERLHLQSPEVLFERAQQHPLLADVLHHTRPAAVHCRAAGTAVLDINNLHSAGPGFIAIGDAAITFDPISSQGLFHALASAESAATAITAGCGHNANALQKFQHELLAISTHYQNKLQLTYQGPARFANDTFWRTRRGDLFERKLAQ